MSRITGENITDEQIRELIPLVHDYNLDACFAALGPSNMFWAHQQPDAETVRNARRHCADVYRNVIGAR